MTLHEAKTLHAYNSWASNRLFEALAPVKDDQLKQDMKSSHGSILGTLIHMVGAEKIWLERFLGAPQPFLSQNPPQSLADLKKIWENTGYETAKWLGMMTDKKLNETFNTTNLKGESFTYIFWQAFQHVVNHSTYHRGQVITLMRQLGVQPPGTDLIQFYRETAKVK